MKARHRSAMGIGTEELKDKAKAAEFQTELLMISGYIGYVDIWDGSLRMFVFATKDSASSAIKAAQEIGFRSAGDICDFVAIRNSDLNRPHLNKKKGHSYYRELYR